MVPHNGPTIVILNLSTALRAFWKQPDLPNRYFYSWELLTLWNSLRPVKRKSSLEYKKNLPISHHSFIKRRIESKNVGLDVIGPSDLGSLLEALRTPTLKNAMTK